MEIKNAQIKSTMLGVEDHGIMTAFLHLDYGGSRQGFGGYDLRHENTLMRFIQEVCKIVGVEKWEDLPGKYVRAESDIGKVHRIGHFLENKWFNPKDLWQEK